ncbi:BgTH12-00178 [Blumeria graminis f. sp. triticale]|nr:BgTH12-00178 [Blumeria graminis f. sp. triticale]
MVDSLPLTAPLLAVKTRACTLTQTQATWNSTSTATPSSPILSDSTMPFTISTTHSSAPVDPFFSAHSSHCRTLSHFSQFQQLPTELRCEIYALALQSRTLVIHYDSSSNSFNSPTAHPTLLSTCRESRIVAQKHYSLAFATSTSPARIYFNPYLDTLYLPRCGEMGYDENFRILRDLIVEDRQIETTGHLSEAPNPASCFDQLRCVAIDHVDPRIKRPWEGYNKASFLRSFPRLEELILVLSSEEENEAPPSPISPINTKAPDYDITTAFRDPRLPPEAILQIWWDFRQLFAMEEHMLEQVCNDLGKKYEGFSLPTVRVRGKVVKKKATNGNRTSEMITI